MKVFVIENKHALANNLITHLTPTDIFQWGIWDSNPPPQLLNAFLLVGFLDSHTSINIFK